MITRTHFNILFLFLLHIGLFLVEHSVAFPEININVFDDVQYKVAWRGPYNEIFEDLTLSSPTQKGEQVIISTNKNEQYKCILPVDRSKLHFDTSAKNSSNDLVSPYKVIHSMSNRCISKSEMFWNYQLCHGKYFRQYHLENHIGQVSQEFYLGWSLDLEEDIKKHRLEYEGLLNQLASSGKKTPTIMVAGQKKPYIYFNMTHGTKCDLIDTDRFTKVIYVCSLESLKSEIYSIREVATCEYEVIVLTPSLCLYEGFKPSFGQEEKITCYSLENSPKKPEYIENQETEVSKNTYQPRRQVAYFRGKTLIIDPEAFLIS